MFRRPDDLWPRLPWQARLSRGIVSLCFILLPALILAETRAGIDPGTMDAAKFSVLGATVVIMIGIAAWARTQRLPFRDGVRMLLGSTMPAVAWQATHMARLLAPVRGVRPPHHARPADWLRAIDDLVPFIADAHASLGAAVAIRAHRLLAAVSMCEEDMDRLGAATNDAEIERLDTKIAELESEIAVRGTDAQRDLLRLLQAQRTILIGMRGDRERSQRQFEGLFQLLRRVWLQLVAVNERPADADPAADRPDPADVLRSLCDEVDEVLSGAPESLPPAPRVARLDLASPNQPPRGGKTKGWATRAASLSASLAGRIAGLFS
jgi:hypothetical protein